MSDFSTSFYEIVMPNGLKLNIPYNLSDFSLQYKMWFMMNYHLFQSNLKCIDEPNQDAVE